MSESEKKPEKWLVLWYNAKFGHDMQEDYASEAEALEAARSYSAEYPWNTYTVARVMGEFPATAPLPSPTGWTFTPPPDFMISISVGPGGGGAGSTARKEPPHDR